MDREAEARFNGALPHPARLPPPTAWVDDRLGPRVDRERLRRVLDARAAHPGLARTLQLRAPDLLAGSAVYLSARRAAQLRAVVDAVEVAVASPAYRADALALAPPIAHLAPGPRGVLLGYDFHLTRDGVQLIEINTNAGGALLVAQLARACTPAPVDADAVEAALVAMFRREWARARCDAPLGTIAIVDSEPAAQLLHAEFLLFQALFERAGLRAMIVAPEELEERDGRLRRDGEVIDLVYARSTDFYLEDPALAPVRRAYAAGGVVVTPAPHAHACYADKRRLATLSDPAALATYALPAAARAALAAGVPTTTVLDAASRSRLWARRDDLYVKSIWGYASAAYRGEDLAAARWAELADGRYVAQRAVPASVHRVASEGGERTLKADFRAYVYAGEVLLIGARLYDGPTTNLRTPGGGFAPVVIEPA